MTRVFKTEIVFPFSISITFDLKLLDRYLCTGFTFIKNTTGYLMNHWTKSVIVCTHFNAICNNSEIYFLTQTCLQSTSK